jgi:hypothetical protein
MAMQEYESGPSDCGGEQSNVGGAAPAHRRCQYTKSDGKPCRSWAVRGQDFCHRHDLFLHSRAQRPIDVPLLEDEASIVLLLSETLRAMAWGTLPVANGRMLLAGCRLAHTIQMQKLEMGKFRLRLRRMGIREEEIFDPAPGTVESQAPDAGDAGNAASENEPLTTPRLQPPDQRHHRFRDLKKNWDKELGKVESEMTDMFAPRYKETREEFNAARATPFENLVKEERVSIAVL